MTTKMRIISNKAYNCYSIRVKASSGTMFVVVSEDNKGNPCMVQIFLGKTGSTLFALLNTIAELINNLLDSGKSIEDVIVAISNTTSDKIVFSGNVPVRSDTDAIVYALMRYKREKYFRTNSTPVKRILNQK